MSIEYIDEKYINGLIKKRSPDTHKGDYGRLLIAAGSESMTGAAILAAKGAFRSGCGLVYLYIPKRLFDIFQIAVPEAICIDRNIRQDYEQYDSIIFGPGLSMNNPDENRKLLLDILDGYKGKLVLDADGINTVAYFNMFDALKESKAEIVLTPHEGEAARLLCGMPDDRVEAVMKLNEITGKVALLKGNRTLISDGRLFVNTTGNPGMATAGSGDVLAGVIASLAGQGLSINDAACAGAYIHGRAGDLAALDIGQWGIMATDIADNISKAIKIIIGE